MRTRGSARPRPAPDRVREAGCAGRRNLEPWAPRESKKMVMVMRPPAPEAKSGGSDDDQGSLEPCDQRSRTSTPRPGSTSRPWARISATGARSSAAITVFSRLGDARIILFERAPYEHLLEEPLPPGLIHTVYEVDDLDAQVERLRASGCHILMEPTEIESDFGLRRICFFVGPGARGPKSCRSSGTAVSTDRFAACDRSKAPAPASERPRRVSDG